MADNKPVVKTVEGSVRGEKLESVLGGAYYSFKGIPYAKPPVGDLRFKPPQPIDPWTGIKDAFKEGNSAPAFDMLTLQYKEDSNEDCLFINVYTPQLPEKGKPLKPVLFWVHGGAFKTGSGDTNIYGPDYLVRKDVLLVTFNYRLGALGFLNLGIPECPGNCGLKDMVAALKWVQRNITVFGGDPNNVTIFGESAGGGAVQYLLLSKLTKGLFHKAISQSGVTLNPWAVCEDPKAVAVGLAEALGYKSTNEKELLAFFKTVEPRLLVEKDKELPQILQPGEHYPTLSLVPSIERDTEGAFITKHPKEIMKSGDFNDVPYMLGATTLEGLIVVKPEKLKELKTEEDHELLIPFYMKIKHGTPKAKEIAKKIRDFYFPNGYDFRRLVDYLSSIWFVNGINETVEYMIQLNRKSPTYLYLFSFDGQNGFFKNHLGYKEMKGTSHGDDLGYLFQTKIPDSTPNPGTPEYLAVERITKLWTNFAKYGNPTPDDNSWKPVSPNKLSYLEIGEELTLRQDLEKDATNFWKNIYKLA